MQRQAGRDLEGASDLATVPAAGRSRQVFVMLGCEVKDLAVLDDDLWLPGHPLSLGFNLPKLGDVKAEDVACLSLIEGRL